MDSERVTGRSEAIPVQKSPGRKLEVTVRLADCRPDEGSGPSARGFCVKLALMGILPAYGGRSETLPPQPARRPRNLSV
jgi:hypothetical protein